MTVHFIETISGYVNLDHVVEITGHDDATYLTLKDGTARRVAKHAANALDEAISRAPLQIVPAVPGYSLISVMDDGDGPAGVWSVPIIAWRINADGGRFDYLAEPICDDGFVPRSYSDTYGWNAIERPDGAVYFTDGDTWPSRDDFVAKAKAHLRMLREKSGKS